MKRAAVALVLASCGSAAMRGDSATGGAAERDAWRYDVVVADDLSRFDVTIAFRGSPPKRLILGDARGLPWIVAPVATVAGAKRPLARDGDSFVAQDVGDDATIAYRVDVAGLVEGNVATRVGRSICATPGTWLLRPMPLPDAPAATLALHLAPGDEVTAPWTPRDDGTRRLDATTFRWRGFFAVGRVEKHEIDVADARLDVAVLDRPHAATWPGLEKWIATAARAQTSLYGAFPAPRAQIVVKTSSSHQAVPFGETQRGGGSAVVLLIGDEAGDAAFGDDWVAVHEMAHLGMPAIEPDDAWMSEGFITYYQNVLMARSGMYDERRAWDEIVAGFGRGRARRRGADATLAETSAGMSRSHSYMRVYWGGAAIAMLLDVELRRSTNGAKSLDDAMREIRRAFAGRGVEASADAILKHLDAWLGRPLFSETARRALASKEFPSVDDALARLGVVVERGNVTGFNDAAPDAAIRRAITAAAAR